MHCVGVEESKGKRIKREMGCVGGGASGANIHTMVHKKCQIFNDVEEVRNNRARKGVKLTKIRG